MRNAVRNAGIFLCTSVLMGIFAFTSLAQSSSPGCAAWNSIGNTTFPPGGQIGVLGETWFDNEVVQVRFTLATPGTAYVNLSGSLPLPTNSFTLSAGYVILNLFINSDGIYGVINASNSLTSTAAVDVSFNCISGLAPGAPIPDAVIIGSDPTGFTDGRINHMDAAAPIVVYSYQDESGLGFDIYDDTGELLVRVTGADLLNLPYVDATYDIVISETEDDLYQITAPQYNGKTYILQVDEPLAGIGYTSWEQE